VPTARVPCLKACPRTTMVHQTSRHALAEAPDSLLLDDLVDLYEPVHFDHQAHASMAEMGKDCAPAITTARRGRFRRARNATAWGPIE